MDVVVDGLRTHLAVVGDGPPVVVIHGGLGTDHQVFRPWLDPLGDEFQLLLVDLTGNGRSDDPPQWDDVGLDTWVRQLDEMKRALRPLGVAAAPHDPPRALAARVRERLGGLGEPLAALLDAFEARRYGRSAARRPDPTMTRDFTRQARRLRAGAA